MSPENSQLSSERVRIIGFGTHNLGTEQALTLYVAKLDGEQTPRLSPGDLLEVQKVSR